MTPSPDEITGLIERHQDRLLRHLTSYATIYNAGRSQVFREELDEAVKHATVLLALRSITTQEATDES